GLGALEPEFVGERLHDADAKVRVTAIRLADRTLVPDLVELANDPSAEVRAQLAFSLSPHPGAEVAQALVALLRKGGSTLLTDGVATGLRGREIEFLDTLLKQKEEFPGDIITTLAGCVMSEHRSASVARLL